MKHEIKLSEDFDRRYQKGDLVRFSVVDRSTRIPVNHPLNECEFEITYVLSGWGIDPDYCVFSIELVGAKK